MFHVAHMPCAERIRTALIIIDQCSRVFFDRTKPLDQRPEVMDLFAAAIGHVVSCIDKVSPYLIPSTSYH